MKNILIYGASGHSKMIVDIIIKNKNYNLIGFLDSYKPIKTEIYGFEVIGTLDGLSELLIEHNIHSIVIGIGDNFLREEAYKKIIKIAPSLKFVSVVHPSAILANDIVIPQGTVAMANVVINASAKIGEFCILNTSSSLGHDSEMANFSSLASGVVVGGNVQIGYASAICLGASITQGITIGSHTVIGAASLVLKSIGDFKQAYGIPISTIKDREIDSKYLS